jgi:hypothetical protein
VTAHHLAKAIIKRFVHKHMNGKPAWVAELELADTEAEIADLIEPALDEQFGLGWRERGWVKEENEF